MEKINNCDLIGSANLMVGLVKFILMLFGVITCALLFGVPVFKNESVEIFNSSTTSPQMWSAPDIKSIPINDAKIIEYGRALVIHTNDYLGPAGKIRAISNGMSCTNCHLDGGTKPFGNNFSAVASTYPKFRPRYGAIESIEYRVNECIARSLNGNKLDTASYEMKAFVAYIRWLGKNVKKGTSPPGSGLVTVPFLDRAASPKKGKVVYDKKCAVCHGTSGEGMLKKDSSYWLNPPLWGSQSYTIGAGIYRLGRFAGFVKANMPWSASYDAPQLSDEEAWDVAAYVNSLPRPEMDVSRDWPDLSQKAFDYPFGPYKEEFSPEQHKFGPFKPIQEQQKRVIAKH